MRLGADSDNYAGECQGRCTGLCEKCALRRVRTERDLLERAIVGMMATMMPDVGPTNAGHYVVMQETEEAAKALRVTVRRDDYGRMLVVVA